MAPDDGDHDRQGQDGDPEMVGRDQDGADDDEPKDRADHVHRAVVAGGLGPLIRRHLVGQHALVRALRRVRRHLEEDVDDQQHPVRRDKRDDREENHVADDADRDERPAPANARTADIAERADRRLPDDREGGAKGIEDRDVRVHVDRN